MKKLLLNRIKTTQLLFSFCFMLFMNLSWGQNPPSETDVATDGDYRTAKTTGNWNDTDMWQVRNASAWAITTTPPGATNTVFIQSGHAVTVTDASVSCYSLHISITGILAIGSNIVNVNGKVRAFTGLAETSTADGTFLGTDSTTPASTMITTSGSGVLKFVGNTRNIAFSTEWNSTGTSNAAEFALTSGQTGSLTGTGIKFKTIIFSSGVITTDSFISASTGDLTIKSGATLITSRSSTGGVIGNSSSAVCGIVSIEAGGILELTGTSPTINCTTFSNNGIIKYTKAGSQNLLASGTVTGTAGTTAYNNYSTLILGGTSTKTLFAPITVSTLLKFEGTNTSVSATSINTITMLNDSTIEKGTSLNPNTIISTANAQFVKYGTLSTDLVNLKISASTTSSGELISAPPGPGKIGTLTVNNGVTYTISGGRSVTNIVNNGIIGLAPGTSMTLTIGGTLSGSGTFTSNISTGNVAGSETPEYFSSSFDFTNTGTIGTLNMTPSAKEIKNLSVKGNLTLGSSIQLNGNLVLTSGTLANSNSLTLLNAASPFIPNTISISAGSLDSAPTFGSNVNVNYNGTTAITTGFEIPADTNKLNDLTINNAAGVTLNSDKKVNGALTLTTGNLITGSNKLSLGVNGTIIRTAGAIDCSASSATTEFLNTNAIVLPASLFSGTVKNLTINGGGVTLGSATALSGVLTVTAGTFNTGDFLTLKSDAIGTARVANVLGSITGKASVERYIPAKRGWRALTAPVVGSTNATVFNNWQNNGTVIANTGVEIWSNASSDVSVTNAGSASSLLSYDSAGDSWTPITNTSTTSLFTTTVNNPFMVFVTGPYATTSTNITNGTAATTLKATGTLLTGTQTYPTSANTFTFIGNPYASPLDLTAMLTTNLSSSFGGNIWVWDANATGDYSVGTYNLFTSGTYTNLTSNPVVTTGTLIQSGQAFFVKSTDGASFSIQETHKGSTFSNAVFRDAAPAELLRVGLYKQINTEWSGRDGAMTVITANAEANQVANKMANSTENIAFTKNSELFASEHHLPLVAADVLNVRVWNTTAGANYKLKINTEQFTTTNLDATLEDLFTNSRTPITLDGTAVEYPFSVTTEATSTGNRFRIVFENSALGINNPKATEIKILPNPITGDTFQVNLGTLSTGAYSYSICNTLGQEVEKGSINNVAQNTNYAVKLNNSTAAGMYIIKVTGTDNTVFTAKLIKK